jgi:hypothetical protein
MMRPVPGKTRQLLQEIVERLNRLEHEAELLRTVFIVKEPNTGLAAEAYDGLRKQVAASAAERRSHLAQLASMAVAVRRASSVEDVRPQVQEWMAQAGVVELTTTPHGNHPQDLFEDLEGSGFSDGQSIEVIEPAYVDRQTGVVLRLGRARSKSTTLHMTETDTEDPQVDESMEGSRDQGQANDPSAVNRQTW